MKRPSLTDAVKRSSDAESTDDFTSTDEVLPRDKVVFVRVRPAVKRALRRLAADLDRSEKDLVTESINDLLIKHGQKPQ